MQLGHQKKPFSCKFVRSYRRLYDTYPYKKSGVAHVVNKVFAKVSKKISKVSKRLGCYAFSFIVCAFSSSSSFLRFVYCASYALICDVIFKPPFYLPYSPFLKRKSDQNKIPADPPLVRSGFLTKLGASVCQSTVCPFHRKK